MQSFKQKYIGDRAFYRRVFAVMVPVLIQQVITNFVSLLDNLMVGQIGTEPMSGVAIVNQLLFVFNLCIFGGLAGAGILTAQFYGSGDSRGVADTFRAKLYIALAAVLALNPDVMILDEPYAGLDKKTQEWLTQVLIELKASGKTIIVATHSGELLSEAVDEIIVMK